MHDDAIHIIEPTLVNDAGHCGTVVQSLCAAGEGLRFCVWVGREARLPWLESPSVEVRPYFSRRFRRLQAMGLYWRLLRKGRRIIVTTAGRTDLALLNFVSGKPIEPGRVFLYVHQLRMTQRKEAALRKLAGQQPNVTLIGTTDALEKMLREFGFRHTMVVLPLPAGAASCTPGESEAQFQHVLVAGAARSDKGFSVAVSLIDHLAAERASLPVVIQSSGDHYGRYDEGTQAAITRLHGIRYEHLRVLSETLTRAEYVRLFQGAICLQPYDRKEYADKLSGITLDAFMNGAPVVTVSRTWMAKMVEQFSAGVVVEEPTSEALYDAVQRVRQQYVSYSDNALKAGRALARQHQWAALIDQLKSSGPPIT